MASSQVEVAGLCSSFGCVLRDRNRRDSCSPKGPNSFQRNLKDLVHSCISRQSRDFNFDSGENRVEFTDLWVHKPQYLDERNDGNNRWNSDAASENWGFSTEGKILDCEISQPKSDSSSLEFPHSGGVSSLVRKWSDFGAEAKTNNTISGSNSGSTFLVENEDSSSNWSSEADGTPKSGHQSIHWIDSDATDKERIRVADIVRKLSSSAGDENHDREPSINGGNEGPLLLPRIKTSTDYQPEHLPCFCPVLNSQRIRGRQVYRTFLLQVERDRSMELEGLAERNLVSKFQQRGRIQAMLRLKFLRRRAETREDPPSNKSPSESNRKAQPSILHLRERFNAGTQQSITHSKAIYGKVADSTGEAGKASASNQSREDNNQSTNGHFSTFLGLKEEENHSHITNASHKEVAAIDPLSSQKVVINTQNFGGSFTSTQHESYENDHQENLEYFHDEARRGRGASDEFSIYWEQDDQQPIESDCGCLSSYSPTHTTRDDQQTGSPRQPEFGQDWVNDVSRPRSEWQDLRQARYEEMLDPLSDNNDIRDLLQRRSVSNFLSGSMRDKIEQIIICRSQGWPFLVNSNMQEKAREVEGLVHVGEEEEEDKYEGDSQIREQPDDETGEDFQTWGQNGYDQAASSPCHHSNEIELIYELTGHMKQLHREISELRSSIKSCMNMQAKLQHSLKHEVAAALSQSGQNSKHPSNGKCCICFEMKIDSLLYRCGHMCTCFKCAHELVWGSGKCPVCQAPIIDIVRAVHNHS